MKKIVILGLHITDKVNDAIIIQNVLTKFGCSIKTRLGLHDIEEDFSNSSRLIILELCGDEVEMKKLEIELLKIEGLEVQKMIF